MHDHQTAPASKLAPHAMRSAGQALSPLDAAELKRLQAEVGRLQKEITDLECQIADLECELDDRPDPADDGTIAELHDLADGERGHRPLAARRDRLNRVREK